MIARANILVAMALMMEISSGGAVESASTNGLEIQTITVEGKAIPLSEGKANLGPFPQNVTFGFGSTSNANRQFVRLRYKLEGHDTDWRENPGAMNLTVRFFDIGGDLVNQTVFEIAGDSAGWRGDGGLANSPLTHRREAIVVPARAASLWVVISSAGPPNSVGVYVVSDLVVTKLSSANGTETLMRSPLEEIEDGDSATLIPTGWIRDGTHPSVAKIISLGESPATKAFALLDDDPNGHAEWHNIKEYAPRVSPGDHLVVAWNEMYSVGFGNVRATTYDALPPGSYRFRVAEVTTMGAMTGVEASLAIVVPPPFWKELWFLFVAFLAVIVMAMSVARYITQRKVRHEMLRLKQQQMLEQERLRIAHDIHDDLGARVTQISLLSAMAHDNRTFPEKARVEFDRIYKVSRELVSALYETVWAVSPENDNLDALGNYLCQMVNQLCDQAQVRCRLHLLDLPKEVPISSQTRHNISMAVKEAVHNVIKHAGASEVTMRVAFDQGSLSISIQDDGCGFQLNRKATGNGLANMHCRLENIGGTCVIESEPGKGTVVKLHVVLNQANNGQGRVTHLNKPEKN